MSFCQLSWWDHVVAVCVVTSSGDSDLPVKKSIQKADKCLLRKKLRRFCKKGTSDLRYSGGMLYCVMS